MRPNPQFPTPLVTFTCIEGLLPVWKFLCKDNELKREQNKTNQSNVGCITKLAGYSV